jgi:hypothetical protein
VPTLNDDQAKLLYENFYRLFYKMTDTELKVRKMGGFIPSVISQHIGAQKQQLGYLFQTANIDVTKVDQAYE